MLAIQTNPSKNPRSKMTQDIKLHISKNSKVMTFCFGNKRPVFLSKYLESTVNRADGTHRMRYFAPAIELLRNALESDIIKYSETEYEILGSCPNTDIIAVHIREEIEQKDRRLYLISTFGKGKK